MVWQDCYCCKHELKGSNESPCNECDNEREYYEPKTNADRIRNMTDEELAEYLKIVQEHTIKSQQVDSIEDMLSFLKSEVKEGNSNENT